jgi:hypothetical protein
MSEWSFRYIDSNHKARQSRTFVTRDEALKEACAYRQHGIAVSSLDGPEVRMTAAEIAAWCTKNRTE